MKVLLLFLIVFAPFVFFTVRMLRHTRESLGDGSPLVRSITITWDRNRFFSRFTVLLLLPLPLMGLLYSGMGVATFIRQPDQVLGAVILMLLGVAMVAIVAFIFSQQYRLWKQVRDKRVTFDPALKTITIAEANGFVVVSSQNLASIEFHTNHRGDRKADWAFYTFLLTDERRFSLHDLFITADDLLEFYFSGIPQVLVSHKTIWYEPENDSPIGELCPTTGR
ncbi:hypothetical protein GGR92_005133 [Spirosoma lacussanchae]|uniref:hypothetical protein n=1 Tax=Spirosoma lacussanchae TaxID=1884249 RepID=UPI001109D2C2|nr:hypothetical protein [Spirosoma lacussanchae]